MNNFMDLLTAARLGNERATLDILAMFKSKIDRLAKNNQDIKADLVLEMLEQIKGERKSTFRTGRITAAFWKDDSAHNWSEYLRGKFILWTSLQLSRFAAKKFGKSNISVHIPWYVATATKHYNRLLSHLGSHEEVVNFIEGSTKEGGLPVDVVYSKTMLLNNLKHKGREKLLDKVRMLVSEIPFEPDIHSTPVRAEQELRILTKEFILGRPCNAKVSDRLKEAAVYKAAGRINKHAKEEFMDRCRQHFTLVGNERCNDSECKEYIRCQKEWKDMKEGMI